MLLKDCSIHIFNSSTGIELAELSGHSNWITSCNYSPDGLKVASSSLDQTIRIWDRESKLTLLTLTGYSQIITQCVFFIG